MLPDRPCGQCPELEDCDFAYEEGDGCPGWNPLTAPARPARRRLKQNMRFVSPAWGRVGSGPPPTPGPLGPGGRAPSA